jgi:hypothetical protein
MPNDFNSAAPTDNSLICGKVLMTTLLYDARAVIAFAFKFNANSLCHKTESRFLLFVPPAMPRIKS